MKKRILSGLLSALLVLTLIPSCLAVSGASTPEEEAAQVIRALGIMVGDGSGSLQLDRAVTRAEFITMAVKVSPYADQVGKASVSPFPDVPLTHWSAGYVQMGVTKGYISGYLDGTFRPDHQITLAEGATILLKLLGYSGSDFSGAYPSGQMALFRSLKLDTDLAAAQANDPLTRRDAMYMFYNLLTTRTKTGTLYLNQLGYAATPSGEIDRVSLINSTMDGPVVACGSWQSQIPFDLTGAAVYRAGQRAALSDIQSNDVVYWSKSLRTLWVYGSKVTGAIQALTPSASSPSAVTVAGRSYSIETASAAYDLSDLGLWRVGDTVTLLLGRNGGVAAVADVDAADDNSTQVGVVTRLTTDTYTDANGNSYAGESITLTATDGLEYRYESAAKSYLKVGDLAQAMVKDGKVTIRRVSSSSLAGKVSSDGSTLGQYILAGDVEILDSYGAQGGIRVYPSRLAGVNLTSSQILYYSLNGKGEIDRLILNRVTGDMYSYGILTDLIDLSMGMNIMVTYQLDLGGKPAAVTSNSTRYPVQEGPVQVQGPLTAVERIYNLTPVTVDRLTSAAVYSDNQSYTLSDSVVVYEYREGTYFLSTLGRALDGEFTLTAWYDKAETAGGRIRVLVAK